MTTVPANGGHLADWCLFWIVFTRFQHGSINAVDFTIYFDRPLFQTSRGRLLFLETSTLMNSCAGFSCTCSRSAWSGSAISASSPRAVVLANSLSVVGPLPSSRRRRTNRAWLQ